MPLRHILVLADATDDSSRRSRLAARLAERFHAHLTGVFPRRTADYQLLAAGPVDDVPVAIPAAAARAFDEAVEKQAEDARDRFAEAADLPTIGNDWMVVSGDFPDELIGCVRRADLTVFPREGLPLCGSRFDAASLGLASGRPMLVVPDGISGDASPPGRRVLVGWNGSREAARALQDAWPFLTAADKVFVLCVGEAEDRPEGMLRRHFEHHGLAVEILHERKSGHAAGQVLLEHVERLGADLVVMGLYGHPRLQEWVLGGATREMLERSPVPLLVSH